MEYLDYLVASYSVCLLALRLWDQIPVWEEIWKWHFIIYSLPQPINILRMFQIYGQVEFGPVNWTVAKKVLTENLEN